MLPAHGFTPHDVFARYAELRRYVGWQADDPARLRQAGKFVLPHVAELTADFYDEIQRHPEAQRVITGGDAQIARLRRMLTLWLDDFFHSVHDRDYVVRRWQTGWRHVEIGLRQVYVNAAMSRLHSGMLRALRASWTGSPVELRQMEDALGRAIDLDLATIQDAYEAEKHLRSETAYRNLVEAAGCAILIFHGQQQIAYFNPHAERLTGFSAAEVVGRNFGDTLVPAADRAAADGWIARIGEGEAAQGFEQAVVCRDGTQRLLVWNARRLENFASEAAILAVGHDVTELKSAQSRALQAERLAAIGQTVAGLAHESRNAFQRMQACLEMLALEVEDRPEAMNLVDRIQRAQAHLHQLYEEVRSYAAPINLQWQTADLALAWREAWEQLLVSRRGRQVTLCEKSECPTVCAHDLFAMTQVFRNVLENALAACGETGCIDLHAGVATLDGKPAICISIADDGPGISPEISARVFDPFFTTKTKGTGLGLAIARRIVDAHQGTIALANRPEGGTQAQITLRVERG